MLEYPNINLPDYYTQLLQKDMQLNTQSFSNIPLYVQNDKGFSALVQKYFQDIDAKGNVSMVLKSMGWEGFRDRFASIFIEKELFGDFSVSIAKNGVYGLISFEEKINKYAVAGYSRAFLLGFYQKMMLLHFAKVDPQNSYGHLLVTEELISLLKYTQAKTKKIDWMVIALKHFVEYLGYESVEQHLKEKSNYENLFKLITNEQQDQMMSNFLAYGSSIGDLDMFNGKWVE